jgi:hypothetical protein
MICPVDRSPRPYRGEPPRSSLRVPPPLQRVHSHPPVELGGIEPPSNLCLPVLLRACSVYLSIVPIPPTDRKAGLLSTMFLIPRPVAQSRFWRTRFDCGLGCVSLHCLDPGPQAARARSERVTVAFVVDRAVFTRTPCHILGTLLQEAIKDCRNQAVPYA